MPEGEELNHRSGGYIQIEVPPYEIDFGNDIDVEEEYRGDWEQMNLFALNAKNTVARFSAPTRWPTTRPRATS